MVSEHIIKKIIISTIIVFLLLLYVKPNSAATILESDQPEMKKSSKWFNQGNGLVKAEKYEEAIENFDKAIEENPALSKAWNNKGVALVSLGRFENAITCFSEAIKIDQQYVIAWYNKGVAYINLGKHEDAISSYDKIIEIKPDHPQAWYNKGVALVNLGRYEEAIQWFEDAIKLNLEDEKILHGKGFALFKLREYKDAIKCFDYALSINNRYLLAWYNKGIILVSLGLYEEAISCFDKVVKSGSYTENNSFVYKESIDRRKLFAKAWFNKGVISLKTGHFKEASTAFNRAHFTDSDKYEYWSGWITALYNEGKKEVEEIGDVHKALYVCEKGIVYFTGRDEEDNALKELLYQKGVILMEQGNTNEGYIAFKDALNISADEKILKAIKQLIETKPEWLGLGWWFSGILSKTHFHQFIFCILLIIECAICIPCLLYFLNCLPIKSFWIITLVSLAGSSVIGMLIINSKALFGIMLIEIPILMLIFPLILLFTKRFLKVSIEDFSRIREIWITCILVLIFILFYRNVISISTPLGELKMPEIKSTPEIQMSGLNVVPEIPMPGYRAR